jgi:hypothetical protein
LQINNTFKTPQGTVTFQGELSQEEADYVIQMGLNYLLSQGALPFKSAEDLYRLDDGSMDEDLPN